MGTYSVPLKQLLKPVSVSNADIPLRERLDFWRAVFGSEFELVDDGRNRTAPARAQGYVFGTAALVQLSGPGYRSIRNRRHISRLSSERINIVRRRAKGMVAVMKDGREFICRPGEIFFQRDTNPFLQAFEDGGLQEAEILGLSWADVRSHMQMRDTNHIQSNRLAGYGGALIGAWMDSLIHAVKTLPELDVRQLAEPSTQLVAAVLDGNLNDQGYRAAAINAARLALAKAYIEWQINNPHLNPNLIAGYCRCSVRTLTKIFEPLGGVMNFVRDRRLMRIYAHLTHPGTQRRKLGELARDYGFATHAHFSDAFRRKFDMSPREVLMESLFHTFEKIVPSLDVFDFEAIRATVIRPSNKNTLTEGAWLVIGTTILEHRLAVKHGYDIAIKANFWTRAVGHDLPWAIILKEELHGDFKQFVGKRAIGTAGSSQFSPKAKYPSAEVRYPICREETWKSAFSLRLIWRHLSNMLSAMVSKISKPTSEPLDWETVVSHALSLEGAERATDYGKPAVKVNGRAFLSTGREIGSFALHIDAETMQLLVDNNSRTY